MNFDMPEIIFKLGAEGGSITLMGRRLDENVWLYSLLSSDCSEDRALSVERNFYVSTKESESSSWADAIKLLDHYPCWYLLFPIEINHDFKSAIFDEVEKRGGSDALKSWFEYQ